MDSAPYYTAIKVEAIYAHKHYTYPNTEIISYRKYRAYGQIRKDNAGRCKLPGVSAEIMQDGGQVPEDESNIHACRTKDSLLNIHTCRNTKYSMAK